MSGVQSVKPLVALVVDDHDSSRYVIASLLTRSGFDVVEASTGFDAIDIIRSTSIDLAILDVNLADMSGFEVCEVIRGFDATAWIPVVHVSATSVDIDHRSEGLLRGADAYLVEPVEPREFLATVGALLRRADIRARTAQTASRLRALNLASADVHAASNEQRVYESLIRGATAIAGAPSAVVTHDGGRASKWTEERGAVRRTDLDAATLQRTLAPARAGHTTIAIEDRAIVQHPHVGVCFIDEEGNPAGAVVVPAGVEDLDAEVLPLLAQLTLTVTLAIANIRALDVEHRIALTLQQSLLPQAPPVLAGLEVTFRYAAASHQAQVGGDFYEAFALDDHRVAVAIGDVVGHSLQAATVMGEIRHAIRAFAMDGYDPREVLDRIERLITRFHPTMFTTAVYGVIDLQLSTLTFCSAGHLPFVVIGRVDGAARLVSASGPMLGIGKPAPAATTVSLAPGDRIVMVTDGLVEVRTESLDVGLERLRSAVSNHVDETLDAMVDRILAEVGPGDDPEDDIAIIAFELRP